MRFLRTGTAGIGVLVVAGNSWAATIRVDPLGNNTNGSSFANGFTTIGAAMTAAAHGDTILVSQGTYTAGSSQTASIDISKRVMVRGGYAGLAASPTSPETFNPTLYPTIFSGEINTGSLDDNSQHVVRISATGGTVANTVLEHVTIRLGYADGTGDNAYGGGIFVNNNVTATIRNCIIEDCYSLANGGGIRIGENANVYVRNSLIEDNTAAGDGGGLWATDASTPRILNTIFRRNTAQFGGGAMSVNADNIKFICCTFDDNTATGNGSQNGEGGGVKIYKGSGNTEVDLLNCLFIDNEAQGTSSIGGGASFVKGIGGVVNCTFAANSAVLGGAYYQDNTDSGEYTSTLINCIAWDNGNNEVHAEYGTIRILNSDINGGEAQTSFDAGNSAYVDYDDNTPVPNANINADPLYVNTSIDDYRLQCTSPAINIGRNTAVPDDTEDVNEVPADDGLMTPDRNLAPRLGHSVVDAGAYEVQGDCCYGNLIDPPGGAVNVVDVTDLLLVIANWGCTGTCAGDAAPVCPDGVVDVTDLLAVIANWGECNPDCNSAQGEGSPFPSEDYNASLEACSGLSGSAWSECMLKQMCDRGYTDWCP